MTTALNPAWVAGITGGLGQAVVPAVTVTLSFTQPPPAGAVYVNPGDNIQSVLNTQPAGAYIAFNPGTYSVSFLIPKASQTLDGQNQGAIFDGGSSAQYAIVGSGRNNVTVKGFEVRNYVTPLQRGAIDTFSAYTWLIDNCYIHDNGGAAVTIDTGTIVQNCLLTHNLQEGFSVHGDSGQFLNNEISFNNYENGSGSDPGPGVMWWGWEAGAGKIDGGDGPSYDAATNSVFRGNYVHDNTGTGIWSDWAGRGATIDSNIIDNNAGNGIQWEVSWNCQITNNIITRNGMPSSPQGGMLQGWAYDAGIMMRHSQALPAYTPFPSLVQGNRVGNNYNGITLVDSPPTPESTYYGAAAVKNITVDSNYIFMVHGGSGGFQDGAGTAIFTSNSNAWTNNHYAVYTAAHPGDNYITNYWSWQTSGNSFATWQGQGLDTAGSSQVGAFIFPRPAQATAAAAFG